MPPKQVPSALNSFVFVIDRLHKNQAAVLISNYTVYTLCHLVSTSGDGVVLQKSAELKLDSQLQNGSRRLNTYPLGFNHPLNKGDTDIERSYLTTKYHASSLASRSLSQGTSHPLDFSNPTIHYWTT